MSRTGEQRFPPEAGLDATDAVLGETWERTSRHEAPAIHGATFRTVMATVCTPVAVVTAVENGHRHGTTVGSFCSLSLEPPLILVALDHESDLLKLVRRTSRFGVNVLGEGQDRLARQFAQKALDKFAGAEVVLHRGLPRLPEAGTWLACRVHALLEGGDHTIVIGLVEDGAASLSKPLLYYRRRFVHCEAI